jgi:hypothetical protein
MYKYDYNYNYPNILYKKRLAVIGFNNPITANR